MQEAVPHRVLTVRCVQAARARARARAAGLPSGWAAAGAAGTPEYPVSTREYPESTQSTPVSTPSSLGLGLPEHRPAAVEETETLIL